jgi:hypothetical protein
MEMTRRGFIAKVVAGCWLLVAGWQSFADDAPTTNNEQPTTEFVRLGGYPGRVVPMGDIHTEAKWSG